MWVQRLLIVALISREGNPLNADELKDWMRFKCELKRQWREFTDDGLQQVQGNYDMFVSKVQQRYGDKTDKLMKWIEGRHQRSHRARA